MNLSRNGGAGGLRRPMVTASIAHAGRWVTVAPLPRALTTGFLPPAWSIAAVLAALLGYGALRLAEIRRAEALGVGGRRLPELFRALVPPAVATAIAIWIVSWQGMPYLVLLVAICTLAAELVMRRTRYGAQLKGVKGVACRPAPAHG